MTLQEAKDQIAVSYGFKDWASINFYEIGERLSQVDAPFDENDIFNEAAELYARSKFDQCYNDTCNSIKILTLFTFDVTKPEFKP